MVAFTPVVSVSFIYRTTLSIITTLLFFSFLAGITCVAAVDCYGLVNYYSYDYFRTEYKMDSTSCSMYQYCCGGSCCYNYYYDDSYVDDVVSGGAIAGIVIGSLIGFGVLVSILVCLCCVCARNQTQRSHGGQILTQPGTTFTVTSQTVAAPGSYPVQPTYPQSQPAYPAGYNPAFTPDGQQGVGMNPMAAPPPSYEDVSKSATAPPPAGLNV